MTTPISAAVRTVTVPEDRDNQRLDNFLLGQLKGAPRSLIYKLVRSGQVRINGKRAKPDSRLEGGDLVRIPPVRLEPTGEPGKDLSRQETISGLNRTVSGEGDTRPDQAFSMGGTLDEAFEKAKTLK